MIPLSPILFNMLACRKIEWGEAFAEFHDITLSTCVYYIWWGVKFGDLTNLRVG